MNKVILGSLMFAAGLFLSIIPPFIWGPPLAVAGLIMGASGLIGTTISSAKTVVSIAKETNSSFKSKTQNNNSISNVALSEGLQRNSVKSPEAQGIPTYDVAKWRSLVELDDDVAEAAARARKMGPQYEDLLAEKYLPLNDKNYLLAALTKVIQKANSDLVMSAIEAERKEEEVESKKISDAAFMEGVLSEGEIAGFKLYTMKDGTVALECDNGERLIFSNRHEAQRYTVSGGSLFRK